MNNLFTYNQQPAGIVLKHNNLTNKNSMKTNSRFNKRRSSLCIKNANPNNNNNYDDFINSNNNNYNNKEDHPHQVFVGLNKH